MRNRKNTIIGILVIIAIVIVFIKLDGCDEQNLESVKIGNQIWTTKNLNVSTFRNGDPIPEARTIDEWIKAGENQLPVFCFMDNFSENGKKYGKLYNWYAVNDPRGLAPKGWKIPDNSEWIQLFDYLGGKSSAGQSLKSKEGWMYNGNGTNESGFNGLPGGERYYEGNFHNVGDFSFWWAANSIDSNHAYIVGLLAGSNEVIAGITSQMILENKSNGLYVRCIKNE
jgi:uncharacterized protein (TIGR02145 family)